ncbi:MAG: thymidylate synthase [archaeon]|nr:thymidylate synthase [archaeon]
MVTLISGNDANELFVKIAKKFVSDKKENNPRGLLTWEISDAWIVLENPEQSIVSLPERNLNLEYLRAEEEWYESGDLKVDFISKYSKFWKNLADSNGTINSNYGFISKVEKWNGISQFEWCVKRLKEDPNTRQAIINYNQPRYKYEGNKDLPCTISSSFIKRNGKLDCITLMRSCDFIYGFSFDMPWFTKLQKEISTLTGIPIGKYYHYATSFHVYEKHFNMVKKISEAKTNE